MEGLTNGMKDRLPYFHINYINSIYQNLQQITKDYQTIMRIISSSSNLVVVIYFCHYNKHTDATHRQQKYLHSIIMARRYQKTFRLSSQDTSRLGCIVIVL